MFQPMGKMYVAYIRNLILHVVVNYAVIYISVCNKHTSLESGAYIINSLRHPTVCKLLLKKVIKISRGKSFA